MKFRWNGPEGMKDITLILKNILPAEDSLKPGQIIEIEDNNPIIGRMRMNANWVKVKEEPPRKVKEIKKGKKGGGGE